ncbi:MAG: pyruvate dehydrogenase (acetyl-transferring) E1 component subunit alpha [Bacteroidetes bacterium]|nr:pyruvate dehydrogenase (acetyl-transferring) E1 component subunit alpha [Bacteroidia bacterium]PCH68032.1 MAG: pyruvate dehydrogenase (acetyl-transferring) E1 component subunit alpha [Bacteroidota bacterium]
MVTVLARKKKEKMTASSKKVSTTNKHSKKTYLYWYESMLLMRKFEEKSGQLYIQQKIRGFCHLYIGQEAVAAGASTATRPEDAFITAYRDHALALVKGIPADSIMAELFGKKTGCSKGKGGSMHLFSKEHNFYGGHGIVGGQIPLGAGIAFAENYRESGNVCLTFFGDGAVRQGAMHETFNMAMLWKLPVVFICENNYYAMGTSVERTTNVKEIYKIGEGYDMPSKPVDGMCCEEVHKAVAEAVEFARKGNGPTFLEMRTYRYRGHSMSDPAKYRTKKELEDQKTHDPIDVLLNTIKKNKLATSKEIQKINTKVDSIVDKSIKFAEDSPYPDPEDLYEDIYAQKDYPFIMD